MTAAQIRARAVAAADKAIAVSRTQLGEQAWADLGEWVEEYVVECARLWALEQATGRPQ